MSSILCLFNEKRFVSPRCQPWTKEDWLERRGGRDLREETWPGFGIEAVWAWCWRWPEMIPSGAGRGKQTHQNQGAKGKVQVQSQAEQTSSGTPTLPPNSIPVASEDINLSWFSCVSRMFLLCLPSRINLPFAMLLPPLVVPKFSTFCPPPSSPLLALPRQSHPPTFIKCLLCVWHCSKRSTWTN